MNLSGEVFFPASWLLSLQAQIRAWCYNKRTCTVGVKPVVKRAHFKTMRNIVKTCLYLKCIRVVKNIQICTYCVIFKKDFTFTLLWYGSIDVVRSELSRIFLWIIWVYIWFFLKNILFECSMFDNNVFLLNSQCY